jgi:hypothetical protein
MMKRYALLLGLLTLLLAGCEVIITGPPAEPLRVLEATYRSNFQDQNGRYLICDNRTTTLVYRFRYQGDLRSWRSYLRGQTLGDVRGDRTFYPTSQGVRGFESGYEVTYQMPPFFAPYAGGDPSETVTPQAIDVVPVPQPEVIGNTRLHLTLRGVGADATFVSQNIPVVANCP